MLLDYCAFCMLVSESFKKVCINYNGCVYLNENNINTTKKKEEKSLLEKLVCCYALLYYSTIL